MNENETAKILETIACKLGTTSEYLWNILIEQAPVSAVMDCIQYTLIFIACIVWYKKVRIFANKIEHGNWDELNWIWIGIVSLTLGIMLIAAFFCFPMTFYALIRPEYWALNNLLGNIQ